ncbi:MAG: aspartate--ammonia ligase, partial [Defluviitaleaceae bacterium]|nr:aspartate--ammonia ligase [Defluviitaleaceae bacterium]
DEELDNLHSIYHDQWDWELIITREQRDAGFLKDVVRRIVGVICDTQDKIKEMYPALKTALSRDVQFVTTQELEDRYPSLTPKERERAFTKEVQSAFIMQIGGKLKSGAPHDGRAPDYDDWTLNGDILFWSETMGREVEVSSMGIRVDEEAMDRQLREAGADDRRKYLFHKMLLAGELPLTIAGGIGQSRISMLLLEKAHIGEIQVSVWDKDTIEGCEKAGIYLL